MGNHVQSPPPIPALSASSSDQVLSLPPPSCLPCQRIPFILNLTIILVLISSLHLPLKILLTASLCSWEKDQNPLWHLQSLCQVCPRLIFQLHTVPQATLVPSYISSLAPVEGRTPGSYTPSLHHIYLERHNTWPQDQEQTRMSVVTTVLQYSTGNSGHGP